MRNWWKSLKSLNVFLPINKTLAIKITFFLFLFRIALKLFSFTTFKKIYKNLIQSNKTKDYSITQIEEIAHTVTAISKILPLVTTCLTQALTIKLLLHSDPNVVLKIGVFIERGFEAHAWVEKNGIYIIGESPLTDYTPIWDWS